MGEEMEIILHDVENMALDEIEGGCTRDAVAQTLAFGIWQEDDIDWPRINKAILGRWSEYGREYVLRKAWKLVEERRKRVVMRQFNLDPEKSETQPEGNKGEGNEQ